MIRHIWCKLGPLLTGHKGIISIVAILAVVGLGIAGAVTASVYYSILRAEPSERSARLAPTETQAYLSINLRPGAHQLIRYRDVVNRFMEIDGFEEEFDDLMGQLEEEAGVDLKDDVLPWLTEIAGFVNMDSIDEAPGIVALAGTSNRRATEEVLATLLIFMEDELQIEYSVDEYRGYRINTDEDNQYWTVTQDYLIFSTDRDLFEDVIDLAVDGGPSLADEVKFQDAQKAMPEERVGFGYFDIKAFYEQQLTAIENEYPEDDLSIYETQIEEMPAVTGFSSTFIDEGIRLDFYTDTRGMDVTIPEPNDLVSPDLLPDDTIVLFSFTGIAVQWEEQKSAMDEYTSMAFNMFDLEIRERLGLGFDDIIGWMTGEVAIGMIPPRISIASDGSITVEIAGLFEFEDKEKVEAILDSVIDLLKTEGMEFRDISIDGQEAHVLDEPVGEVYTPGYMFLDNLLVIGSTEQSLKEILDVRGGKSTLAENEAFRRAIDLVEAPDSVFFVHVGQMVDMITLLAPAAELTASDMRFLRYLDPLEALLVTTSVQEEASTSTLIITIEE